MSYDLEAFSPGKNFTLSATSSAARTNLEAQGRVQVRLYNAGTVIVFFRTGSNVNTLTAVTTDTPLPPGAVEVFTFPQTGDGTSLYISYITASGSATVYATTGDGM